MTRKRNDAHSTEFGLWIREQATLDSSLGFAATNIDYMWSNYKTGQWMIIEEKRYRADLTFSQRKQFEVLHAACKSVPGYCGFHLLQFEKTSPDDGRIWLDSIEITIEELLIFLRDFGKATVLVEYKYEKAPPQHKAKPAIKAIIDSGDCANAPAFCVRYANDSSWWRVMPLNVAAERWVPERTEMTQAEWIDLLYRMHGYRGTLD